jgi:hypothetical protein
MSRRSGAGEAKPRPARLPINRSPHPSTETGELQPNTVAREPASEGTEEDIPEVRLEYALAAVLPNATDVELARLLLALFDVIDSAIHEAAQVTE